MQNILHYQFLIALSPNFSVLTKSFDNKRFLIRRHGHFFISFSLPAVGKIANLDIKTKKIKIKIITDYLYSMTMGMSSKSKWVKFNILINDTSRLERF